MKTLRRITQRLARAEDGVALVVAVGAIAALGTMSASALVYSQQNSGHAARSSADQVALALAEAGVNNALATLNAAADAKDPEAVPFAYRDYESGRAEWWGVLAGSTWTLYGRGVVRSTTAAEPVVRIVSGRATLGSALVSSRNNAVWNYIYADELTGCTTFANSVVVDVPVYVRGNLCLRNQAKVTGLSLRVGGNVSISQSASVGEPGKNIREAHVGGTCRYESGAPHAPCGPDDHVYADISTSEPAGLTKPTVDLAHWYREARPGPMHNCTSGSFPGGFDNDTVMNRSRPTVDITPTFPYDCQVRDANGFLLGRIAWTPGDPGSLIIHGTIFFDGDIEFRQLTRLVYQGRGTIYSSGKITIANQTHICGAVGCPDDWNPNQNLLALVAGSSTDQFGFSIGNYSKFQGAVYAVTDFRDGNNTTTWGPIIANQVHLQNSTLKLYVPIDTLVPGMPASYEETTTITFIDGSWE